MQVTDSLALPIFQLVEPSTVSADVPVSKAKPKTASKRVRPEESEEEEVVKSLASVSIKNLKKLKQK